MNQKIKILLVIVSILLIIFLFGSYCQNRAIIYQKVKVIRVIDGDTIEIEGGQKIRYIGMDTPETVNPETPVQCFGQEASVKNKELVGGKIVELEKDVSETDKYGRLLRYVWVNGSMVNEQLIKEGYARIETFPPDIKYANRFLIDEKVAKIKKLGLWNKCNN